MAYGSIIGQVPYLGINATAVLQENVVAITSTQTYANLITFYAPSDFDENNTYTFNGTSITLQDLNNNPIIDGWKSGSPITFYIKGTEAFFKVGGGINDTLPPQVTNFVAIAGDAQVTLSWDAISAEYQQYLQQYVIVYKQNGIPTGVNDGTKVIVPNSETQTVITQLANDTLYGFRMFPVNYKGQYQTDPTAQATATPVDSFKGKRFVVWGEQDINVYGYIIDDDLNIVNQITYRDNSFYPTTNICLTNDYCYVMSGKDLYVWKLADNSYAKYSYTTGEQDDEGYAINYRYIGYNEVDKQIYLSTPETNSILVLDETGAQQIRKLTNAKSAYRIYDDGKGNIITPFNVSAYDSEGGIRKINKISGVQIQEIAAASLGIVVLMDEDENYLYFTRSEYRISNYLKYDKNTLTLINQITGSNPTKNKIVTGRLVENKYVGLQNSEDDIFTIYDMDTFSQIGSDSIEITTGTLAINKGFVFIRANVPSNTTKFVLYTLSGTSLVQQKEITVEGAIGGIGSSYGVQ